MGSVRRATDVFGHQDYLEGGALNAEKIAQKLDRPQTEVKRWPSIVDAGRGVPFSQLTRPVDLRAEDIKEALLVTQWGLAERLPRAA